MKSLSYVLERSLFTPKVFLREFLKIFGKAIIQDFKRSFHQIIESL